MNHTLAFCIPSKDDLTTLKARVKALGSRFHWGIHESHYEGDYLMGEIPGDPHLYKVRIFKEDDEFEVEVWFTRVGNRELRPDERKVRAELIVELQNLLNQTR